MTIGQHPFEAYDVIKHYPGAVALAGVSTHFASESVVGLIGRNGSGKSTLLHHATGLALPDVGTCLTFGESTAKLGGNQLERIGVVPQENRFLEWMTVEQHLDYVASFYSLWDADRERRLLDDLDIPTKRVIGQLSPGNQQKLAILTAVGHHPRLLLLDEPVSALDPIAREEFLRFVLDLVRDDGATVVISSHALRDVERIVDQVVCLERGRVLEDRPLDDLLESYSEWIVTVEPGGTLPPSFAEPFVVSQRMNGHRAAIVVRDATREVAHFESSHGVRVERKALNLERIFPLLIGGEGGAP